ncbi:MAG TPA: glycosyltransferase family 1 protein [Candidatus Binatia bacterium]|nr:glycosyltransferase family 1 protein [Candidatus Binatia bacterium]
MRVAVDATQLIRDGRGMGRYVREILRRINDRVEIALIVERSDIEARRRYAAAFGYYDVPLVSASTSADVYWFPWNLLHVRTRAPRVVTIYDVAPLRFPHPNPWVRLRERRRLKSAVKSARRITTISSFVRDELVERYGVPRETIEVATPGVGAPFSVGPADALPEALHARPYILFVGAPDRRKNLDVLRDAYARAFPAKDVALVIAGGESSFDPDVLEIGYIEENLLVSLYRGASAVVIPSLYEGFGMTALEAMACGAPVVASRTSGLEEACGDAALYVDEPANVDAWVKALTAVMHDEALIATLRSSGLERVGDFSWDRAADVMVRTFEAAAVDGRTGRRS